MFKIYDGREHFYQWDLDRKLIIEDPSVIQVHFCNRTDNCSLVCETYVEDGLTLVNVPNILLQTDWKIRVYAYDGKHTKHDRCYEVKGRSKPADYVYTETQVLNWEQMKEAFEEMSAAAIQELEEKTDAAIKENKAYTDKTANNILAEVDSMVDGAVYEANQYTEEFGVSIYETLLDEAVNAGEVAYGNAVRYVQNNASNILKGKGFGAVVGITDVSPFPHNLKVNVESKNLYYNSKDINRTFNGITATGTKGASEIILNGIATSAAGSDINTIILTPGTYTISILGLNNTDKVNVQNKDTSKVVASGATVSTSKTFTIDTEATIGIIPVIAAGSSYTEQVVKIQIEKGLTATGYTPYIADVSNTVVNRLGKNILPYPYNSTSKVENGLTFTDNGDGSVTVNGTATKLTNFYLVYHKKKPFWLASGTYSISMTPQVSGSYYLTSGTSETTEAIKPAVGNRTFTTTGAYAGNVSIQFAAGAVVDNVTFYPQIEVGNKYTGYETPIAPVSFRGNSVGALYPNTTLMPTVDGVVLDVEYNRDINKAFAELEQAIISLGGNV